MESLKEQVVRKLAYIEPDLSHEVVSKIATALVEARAVAFDQNGSVYVRPDKLEFVAGIAPSLCDLKAMPMDTDADKIRRADVHARILRTGAERAARDRREQLRGMDPGPIPEDDAGKLEWAARREAQLRGGTDDAA